MIRHFPDFTSGRNEAGSNLFDYSESKKMIQCDPLTSRKQSVGNRRNSYLYKIAYKESIRLLKLLKTITMILDHIAIWTDHLEELRNYYTSYFGGISNQKYTNEKKHFQSYSLTFESGARLEIMTKTGIPANLNDTVTKQYLGIIHLAFGVETMKEVDEKAKELEAEGYKILNGPRKTGDGCYEFETLDPDRNRIEVTTHYTED
jgi:lactoylglutathione lyase